MQSEMDGGKGQFRNPKEMFEQASKTQQHASKALQALARGPM